MRFELDAATPKDRVDRVLAARLSGVSRSTIARWIGEGRVLVNGKPCKAKDRVGGGNVIEVEPGPEPSSRAEPQPGVVFSVVYDDEHLVVVDKPAGLVVHPARGHRDGTLVNGLLALPGFGRPPSDERDPEGPLRPGIVHRIDKDTSGLLVVAKTSAAREGLKLQFAEHTIERAYLALTLGVPAEGRIETLHGRHPHNRLKFSCRVDSGKRCVTDVSVVQRFAAQAALVRCTLQTGRTHQIRVHLSEWCDTPIFADALYGRKSADPELASVAARLGRQGLHAAVLGFTHPVTLESLRFESQLPQDMREAANALAQLNQ